MSTVDTNIELARYYDSDDKKVTVTIGKYNQLLLTQDREALSEFVYHRLHCRYLKSFFFPDPSYKRLYKNGFSLMANACLLIETIQSFKNGWGDSNSRSKQAFVEFFESETNFLSFRSHAGAFYTHIRCGILHQGETSGGWKIKRDSKLLFDQKSLTINATKFVEEMNKSLRDYKDKLQIEKWDGPLWDNFRIKMRKIIANCAK